MTVRIALFRPEPAGRVLARLVPLPIQKLRASPHEAGQAARLIRCEIGSLGAALWAFCVALSAAGVPAGRSGRENDTADIQAGRHTGWRW